MKQCQSCGMPLQSKKAGDCRGSEANGGMSEKWCKLCYENGAFLAPDCTLDEMKQIVDRALIENGSGRIMRWLAREPNGFGAYLYDVNWFVSWVYPRLK